MADALDALIIKEDFSKRLKKKALDLGADVVGIAGKEGFGQAPEGYRPENILRGATCVISLGFAQPNTVVEKAMPTQYTRNIFTVAFFGRYSGALTWSLDRRTGLRSYSHLCARHVHGCHGRGIQRRLIP